jgi:hypothetical protein
MSKCNEAEERTAVGDGADEGQITELLVHVVRARARVIAQVDAKVLDLLRALLEHLRQRSH